MCTYSKYARLIIHISPNTREGVIMVNHVRRGCLYVNRSEMHVFCFTRLQTLALQWSQKECRNIRSHFRIYICGIVFLKYKAAGSKSIVKVQGIYFVMCLWFVCCNPSLYLISAGAFSETVAAWKNLIQKQSYLGLYSLKTGGWDKIA